MRCSCASVEALSIASVEAVCITSVLLYLLDNSRLLELFPASIPASLTYTKFATASDSYTGIWYEFLIT